MNWPTVKLDELCHVVTKGTTPTSIGYEHSPEGVPFLRIQNLQGNTVSLDNVLFIDNETHKALKRSIIKAGDLLITIAGTIGRTAIVPDDFPECNCNQAVAIIRFDTDRLLSSYLLYWLNSVEAMEQIAGKKVTATISNLSLGQIRELKIPLPPLETQKQIAAVLKKADQLRKDCQQMEKELNSLAQSVFIDMFGSQAESYSEWPTKRIEELAENKKGSMRTGPFGSDLKHSEFVDEGIAVIGIDNAVKNEFAWGERRFITTEKYEKLKRYRVYPKDLIITIMGTTGRIAVIPDDIPVSISTKHLAVITLDKEKVKPDFLAIAIKTHPDLLSQIKDSNKGAIMDGLNLSLIKALTFRLPPIDLQLDYLAALKVIQNRVDEVRLSHVQAVNLFNSLMQKAFSGELNLVNAKT